MLRMLEGIKYTGKKAKLVNKEFHKADIKATWADITKAKEILTWGSKVGIRGGIKSTIEWQLENWNWLKNVEL
jgi:UDP-glucuronate 4-epimerase